MADFIKTQTTDVVASGTGFNTVLSFTIAAGTDLATQVWRVMMWGVATQPSDVTPDALQARVLLNNNGLMLEMIGPASTAINNASWRVEKHFAFGASGAVREQDLFVHRLTTGQLEQVTSANNSFTVPTTAWTCKLDIRKVVSANYGITCQGAIVQSFTPIG